MRCPMGETKFRARLCCLLSHFPLHRSTRRDKFSPEDTQLVSNYMWMTFGNDAALLYKGNEHFKVFFSWVCSPGSLIFSHTYLF